jgi:hypothetical protein
MFGVTRPGDASIVIFALGTYRTVMRPETTESYAMAQTLTRPSVISHTA